MPISDDMNFDLVARVTDYVLEHGLPSSPEAIEWIQNPNFEAIFEGYFSGNGFTPEEWANLTESIEDIHISEWGDGIWVSFDYEFESDDGGYYGERQVATGL